MSRIHCELLISEGVVVLFDAGSRWGTQVAGRKVDRTPLSSGAVIVLGDTELRVEFDAAISQTVIPAQVARATTASLPTSTVALERSIVLNPEELDEAPANQTTDTLDLNALVGQQFQQLQVEKIISRAASGIVYQAIDLQTRQAVALKIFWPALFTDQKVTDRFLRSMRAMLPLDHPHLVRLHAAGQSRGHCFTFSEFVVGESAAQLISRIGIAGMLNWQLVWKIGLGLARALEYIHERNVLHRNLRPNNFLLRSDDQCAKLGDTMLAKSLDQAGQEALTQRGEVVGDLYYLSPEQVSGSVAVDQRTDLYSLGAALYALLSGKPPFLGGPADVIHKILNEPPVPPTRTHLTIPASFEGIVLRLLAKHPDSRYANATLVVRDLERTGRHANLMK